MSGFKHIRSWGDSSSKAMEISAQQSFNQILKTNHGAIPRQLNSLAISGGGADGAFGAGLLYGWGKTGKRPVFHMVSGISTGAFIAPFIFLGADYDKSLKEVYTTLSDNNIYQLNSPIAILYSYINPELQSSVASNLPMKKVIKRLLNQAMLDRIGKEHLKGRRLLIGTTQLNAQRLVIWDIGAIAVSQNPRALNLVHKILFASSALPGIFPPEYFPVRANGKNYKEMHIDGGIESQVMLYEKAIRPFAIMYRKKGIHKTLYIIRNRKTEPEWENVSPRVHRVLERVVSTLTKNQGIGDLYRMYAHTLRDHLDYNLAYIPTNFKLKSRTSFDKRYMKKLFELGAKLGNKGYAWKKYPPGLYG